MSNERTVEDRARFEVGRCYSEYLKAMTEVWATTNEFSRERAAQRALREQITIDSLVYAITDRSRAPHFVSAFVVGERKKREQRSAA